jgi:hypothetical protein
MARGVKKNRTGGTDFSITDAIKRAKMRRKQLNEAAGHDYNEVDDISRALDEEGQSEYEKKVFED